MSVEKLIEKLIIGAFIALIALLLGTICFQIGQESGRIKMIPVYSTVNLSETEKETVENAIYQEVQGNKDPLDKWIEKMKKDGKYGIIPNIPSEFQKEGITHVGGKTILMPSK